MRSKLMTNRRGVLWGLILVLLLAPRPVRTECIDYSEYLRWLASAPTSGSIVDLATSGSQLYAAVGSRVEFYDASLPAEPVLVGSIVTEQLCAAIAVSNSVVYTAEHAAGFGIYDISDPGDPQLIRRVETPDLAIGVAISGEYACVSDYSSLQVVWIGDPHAASIVGSVALPYVGEVALAGQFAYVVCGGHGFAVVDLSEPSNPRLLGSVDTPGNARGVELCGTYACVADEYAGLQMIDITDPWNPVIRATFDTVGPAVEVSIRGTHACVAEGVAGIETVSLDDPIDPVLMGALPGPHGVLSVAWSGQHLFGGCDGVLAVAMAANPASPGLIGQYDTSSHAYDVDVEADLAVVADGANLKIIDVGDPSHPILRGSCSLASAVFKVDVEGGYAFASDNTGLRVVSLGNPASPAIVGTCLLASGGSAVRVSGNRAYVCGAAVWIIDVSDPAVPALLGSWHPGATSVPVAVDVQESYAYVGTYDPVNGGSGIRIVDITNPAVPLLVGVGSPSNGVKGLSVAGDHLYVATISGLDVWDVASPASPVRVAHVPGDSDIYATDVAVENGIAYVATADVGVAILDVTVPAEPELIALVVTPNDAKGVALAGDLAYLACAQSGLCIAATHCSESMAVEGQTAGSAAWLAAPYPNPTGGDCTVRWRMDRAGEARLTILDPSGRVIRHLAAGRINPGEHIVSWDGRDAAGRTVAPGVYFVRVDLPNGQQSRRVTVLR